MANVHNPTQNIKTDIAMLYAQLNNTDNTPLYFSMENYDLGWFITHIHANGSGGSLTLQMRQRVGAGGDEADLKDSATLVTAGTLNVSLFARGEDFTATYTHIGILIDETLSQNVTVSSVLCRLRARYKQATLPD
jgi:hypothetical protein